MSTNKEYNIVIMKGRGSMFRLELARFISKASFQIWVLDDGIIEVRAEDYVNLYLDEDFRGCYLIFIVYGKYKESCHKLHNTKINRFIS